MSSPLPLLADIRSSYSAGYDAAPRSGEKSVSPINGPIDHNRIAAAREDARLQLAEHLGLLCTAICISDEDYVRAFPAEPFVVTLTEILRAAHTAQVAASVGVNPLSWEACESSARSMPHNALSQLHVSNFNDRDNRLFSAAMPCAGMQAASPIEVLVLRALALIAEMVPSGSPALRSSRCKDTLPTLAVYLTDPEFLLVNEDLAEELLKCFFYISLVSHGSCLEAAVPVRIVELLQVFEPHHLRLLCLQVLSNLIARGREQDLPHVWSPVLSHLLESLNSFLLEHSLHLQNPAKDAPSATTNPQPRLTGIRTSVAPEATPASTTSAGAAAPAASPAASAARTLSSKEATLLQNYMECVAHAIDRFFVNVASMKRHLPLLEEVIGLCVRLLQLSLQLAAATYGEWLRSVAMSPIVGLFLANPTFAMPVLLRLRVLEAVCGCMVGLVEHREEPGKEVDAAAAAAEGEAEAEGAPAVVAAAGAVPGGELPSTAGNRLGSAADATNTATSATSSQASLSERDSHTMRDGGAGATRRANGTQGSGPVLTTDAMTIPFIADELRLLALLEFLLVLLPCARRGHSHTDYRNTTLPYYRWTWEDDFHNETECNEALSRRLERVYQQTRTFRTHELFAMTHGKQRVFYTDFLSKSYVSERRKRHSLHRKPILAGYVHDSQNALLRGCTCCVSKPAPLFSTWVNRNYMRLRTAETETVAAAAAAAADGSGGAESSRQGEESGTQADAGLLLRPSRAARDAASPVATSHSASPSLRAAALAPPPPPPPQHRHGPSSRNAASRGVRERDVTPSQSLSPQSRGLAAPTVASSRGQAPYRRDDDDEDDEVEYYTSANGGSTAAQQRSLTGRRRRRRLGFLLCGCDTQNTATAARRLRHVRMQPTYLTESPSLPTNNRSSLNVTILPMEAMLEGPGERLQADADTRRAFLGEGVLSSILATALPALLSVLDNCVNPVVARHSVTLLLRCLSLCADLRTQVTGEPIELPASGDAAPVLPTGEVPKAKSRAAASFRKWITGGGAVSPTRWQKAEWEEAQATLKRFVPSLREVLVSLYIAGGVHIVAERQELFDYLRDDLLMGDELARVGLSTDFSAFQLALPSEQHMCTADAMVLLLGLFPRPKAASKACSHSKGTKQRSSQRPPRPHDRKFSPVMSMSSFEASSSSIPIGQSTPLAAQTALQHPVRDASSPAPLPTVLTQATPMAPSRGSVARATLHGSRLTAPCPSSPSARGRTLTPPTGGVDGGSAGSITPRLGAADGATTVPAASRGDVAGGKENVQERLRKVVVGTRSVFTAHQSTVLFNFARQMMRRSQKVCAAAREIHESMNHQTFYTRVVIGTAEHAETASLASQLRSKEMTLRLFPDARCPYHSTFPTCTETFFHASKSLLEALVVSGGSPLSVCGADAANVPDAPPPPAPAGTNRVLPVSAGPAAPRVPPSAQRVLSAARSTTPSKSTGVVAIRGGRLADAIGVPRSSGNAGAGVTVVPVTVNAAAMKVAIRIASEDTRGANRRLPPALRGLLGFYDYCKTHNVELRAAVAETPELLGELAEQLEELLASRTRQREDAMFTTMSFISTTIASNPSFDAASTQCGSVQLPQERHLRLDSTSRGKLLSLLSDFAATIGRDLGLASLDLAPTVVMKQPSSFQKRARRLKTFGGTRHLVWRPLCLSLETKAPTSLRQVQYRMTSMNESQPSHSTAVVVVRRTALPVTTGARLRNSHLSVLPTTTIGQLADAVAALVLVPPAAPSGSSSRRRRSQPSTSNCTLHATQDQLSSSDTMMQLPSSGSPHLTSHHSCEESGRGDDQTRGSSAAVSADRILFFVNNVPLLSPLITVLDALTAFAESGASMRELVSAPQRPADSLEAHNANVIAAMPALPFWTLAHSVHFVVLAEPLPISLVLSACTATSGRESRSSVVLSPMSPTASQTPAPSPRCCCCGCDGMRASFYCSPKHLFDAAPPNGPLALYSALSTIMRDVVSGTQSLMESNQRRLSSAVVHELYHQLNMFILPPLLWCSGIGAAAGGGVGPGDIGSSSTTQLASAFPLPSYVLWCYPFIFSAEMRLSIFKFFVSAQRSLTHDQSKHLLQCYRHLLVHRDGAEATARTVAGVAAQSAAPGSSADSADEALRTLDVVGLQWLSEDVVRRRRVTVSVQRHDILRSAEELLRLAMCSVTIDVAFEGEAGIGKGPAMEFYELVAEELVSAKSGLWRTEPAVADEAEGDKELLPSPLPPPPMTGLAVAGPFQGATLRADAPPPLPQRRPCMPLYPAASQTPESLHRWKLLGALLGRLLVIGSTTSLHFHPLLLRRLRGESLVSSAEEASHNMAQIDAALEGSLKELEHMDAEELAACDLFFTVPASEADGCLPLSTLSEEPLLPGGAERQVTANNVHEYTLRLRTYYLHTVSDVALLQLRQGLQYTVNPLYFQLFTADELGRLLGSSNEDKIWETREQFARSVEAAHGYHSKSDMVQYLLDIIPTWSARMQHAFLKFVTGSSAVPYGGLTQRIKVVRRDVDMAAPTDTSASPVGSSFAMSANLPFQAVSHDKTLPTVSTCFLYLKLPQYTSKAVLQERLHFAVLEGQSFFSLT